jgi:hypothetical protein
MSSLIEQYQVSEEGMSKGGEKTKKEESDIHTKWEKKTRMTMNRPT